jgi:hypothetical protein
MRWLAYTLQVVLALLFLFSAYGKVTAGVEEVRIHLGIAPWFWALIAVVEVAGALALLGSRASQVTNHNVLPEPATC